MSDERSRAGSARRRLLLAGALAPVALALPGAARAGAQIEEPLADAVRSALSADIAGEPPREPSFDNIEQKLAYWRWLGAMSSRLRRREPEHVRRDEFLKSVWYESKRAALEPALVLGLIQVESGFRRYAISSAGARGYMQVMPFWARLLGKDDPVNLFDMATNLRFGCVILRHYRQVERDDMFMALGRYNGSRGKPQYPNAVFGARKAWLHPDG